MIVGELTAATTKLNRVSTLHNFGCFQGQTKAISTDVTKCVAWYFMKQKGNTEK